MLRISANNMPVEVVVSDEDADQAQYSWSAMINKNGDIYFVRRKGLRTIYLHREILQCGKGEEADHRSGNTLDCRRSNLRKATRSQQNLNQNRRIGKTGWIGVYPSAKGFQARFKKEYLGTFGTAEEAAKHRDQYARQSADADFVRYNYD